MVARRERSAHRGLQFPLALRCFNVICLFSVLTPPGGAAQAALLATVARFVADLTMSDADREKKVKKKGWQPKRADWRAGTSAEVCPYAYATARPAW